MEPNALKIASDASLHPGQDLTRLRQQGIAQLQKLAPETWSDHNVFDPGITLLEVLAYVLSDLSYKLSYPVADLLEVDPQSDGAPDQFLTSDAVMFSHCVTLADYRRLFLDIPIIKNLDIQTSDKTKNGETCFDLMVQLYNYEPEQVVQVQNRIHHVFSQARCVTHQLGDIAFYNPADVKLGMKMVLENTNSIVDALVDILAKVALEISPTVKRYSATELFNMGMYVQDIYQGPRLNNGYILDSDLENTPIKKYLYSSDILDVLRQHQNIKQIEEFRFITEGGAQPGYEYWQVEVAELDPTKNNLAPQLGFSSDAFFEGLSLVIEGQDYHLSEQEIAQIKLGIAAKLSEESGGLEQSFAQSEGQYVHLSRYDSLQHELPKTYAVTEQMLNREIDSAQKAQLLQFKGYLHLFDQLLADQHKQIDILPHVLALPQQQSFEFLGMVLDCMLASEAISESVLHKFWQRAISLPHTQLSQAVTGISGVNHLIRVAMPSYLEQGLQQQLEIDFSIAQLTRLNDSAAHLLARFAIKLPNANLLKYREAFSFYMSALSGCELDPSHEEDLLTRLVLLRQYIDKCRLLNEIGTLGHNRCRGFNYLSKSPKTAHLSSLSQLVMRNLGFSHQGQMPLATHNRESFYLLEGDLISEQQSETLFFVLPNWTTRLNNENFQRLVESQIVQHVPLHMTVRCVWLQREQMSLFERLYYGWLNFYGQAQRERFCEGQAHIANVATDIGELLELILLDSGRVIELIIEYVLAKPQGGEVLETYLLQILQGYASAELPDDLELNGDSYQAIMDQITEVISTHSELYPQGFNAQQVIYLATQLCIDHICTPNAFTQPNSNTRFTVGYSPLAYLKPILPVSFSQINSNTAVVSKFIVATSVPNRIDPEGNEE
ncbi:hypothetical protein A7985_02965 [Pseudoalteromonas luteoviolacea]|uniref:Uncharacterized protein n=1 Tax=Pseudoalteromonas luteoviolacea TaxID=43657 RepID=A0A1C0TUE0_9GAMM|nr:hypothetical protein [Pseudoalteromonas luteoviolacea]OCQ22936.1 hypothetical protein A7985_02965 [Pseudoalteromonas luteoviolacea]